MIKNLVKMTGRPSMLAFLLFFVILISALIIPIFGILQLVEKANDGESIIKFESFCD